MESLAAPFYFGYLKISYTRQHNAGIQPRRE